LSTSKAIQSLYIELLLTIIVISLGSLVLSIGSKAVKPYSNFGKIRELEVLLLNRFNKAIIANWGNYDTSVTFYCLINDSLKELSVFSVPSKSTLLVNINCPGKEIFVSGDESIPIINFID